MRIDEIVALLGRIFEAVETVRVSQPEQSFTVGQLADLAVRPLAERVTDPRAALEFAAQCVGETLHVCGGSEALARVLDGFEVSRGDVAAGWLDACWTGVGGHAA